MFVKNSLASAYYSTLKFKKYQLLKKNN